MNLSDKFSGLLNSEGIKSALSKLKKDKKTLIILVVGILGMLFIMMSPSDVKGKKNNENSIDTTFTTQDMQEEIRILIESIKGAGETKVFITYESDGETVYAVNTDEKADGSDVHLKSEYIITDDENGLILKVLYPEVRGVAVICKGGNDPVVKEKIYSVISALFGISSNKISVADMA